MAGKVVSFLNQKGGVGKTTMAFNMAFALKKKNKKVLCLDMDPQGNLSLLFNQQMEGESPKKHIFHLLMNSIKELKSLHSDALFSDVKFHFDGIDILPAGQELSGFELTVAGINAPRQLILKRFIERYNLLDIYDYIIIDGPPTLGLLVVNIICASHGLLIPFRPDQFSRMGLRNFHEVLEDVEDMGLVTIPKIIGYIPNLINDRRKQTAVDFTSIEEDINHESFGGKIFSGFADRIHLSQGPFNKKSVFHYEKKEYKLLKEKFNDLIDQMEQTL